MIYVHSEEMKYADTVQCIACLKLRSILVFLENGYSILCKSFCKTTMKQVLEENPRKLCLLS